MVRPVRPVRPEVVGTRVIHAPMIACAPAESQNPSQAGTGITGGPAMSPWQP
jgi:hypothetical protein